MRLIIEYDSENIIDNKLPTSKFMIFFAVWLLLQLLLVRGFSVQLHMSSLNVFGKQLVYFGGKPIRSGFFRDGFCRTSPQDYGVHSVASIVSSEFLNFSGLGR